MKYCLLLLIVFCSMGAGWNYPPVVVSQPVVVTQPYYTVTYVPVVKQEIVMVPVVQDGLIYYYYPSTRWVPQPAPWTPDPYTEWLRCRHSNYRY